jgi:hypothetical protein
MRDDMALRWSAEESDARRQELAELARAAGWPRLGIRPGECVMAGENCWRVFVERASDPDVAAAIVELQKVKPQMNTDERR